MVPALVGPPEIKKAILSSIKKAILSSTRQTAQPSTAVAADPFMDLMVSNFNNVTALPPPPPRGFTENGSATYLASGNPCVDFFFHVVPSTPAESIKERLGVAWEHDALTTLKLICHLRGVRGTGKSDKEGFYTAAFWLHGLHPKTLACNIGSIADFGYFKDLPEILYRVLEGADIRQTQKQEWRLRKAGMKRGFGVHQRMPVMLYGRGRSAPYRSARAPYGGFQNKKSKRRDGGGKWKKWSSVPKEIRIQNAAKRAQEEKEKASLSRKEKKIANAKKLLGRYGRDPDFKFLYERVSDHFAECLKADMDLLKSGETRKISLAAKWCPSLDSSFDRSTLLCESIARRIFNRESYPEYEGVEEAHYAYRIRDRLRKEVLVPLRKVLELPEVYIGANDWKSIPYNRVASVAMKLYKEKFMKHDGDRFAQYLKDVEEGKTTIAAGALLPHEIIASLTDGDGDGGQVAELQWKRMVEDMLKLGKLKNCIAVCDVSGSMDGTPMEVCVALGLLLSELSEDPWKGKVITFSHNPQLHLISGSTLHSKTSFIRTMDWGMNTDFQKVFDLILSVAVAGNLKPEQMIKRVFVFSDMEFDQASRGPSYGCRQPYGYPYGPPPPRASSGWETDYEVIQRKYKEKGYGSSVPEIVFWNLRDSMATPVPSSQKGVALVSGFSKNLMKLFLENDGAIDPEIVMQAAIAGPEYHKLAVLD